MIIRDINIVFITCEAFSDHSNIKSHPNISSNNFRDYSKFIFMLSARYRFLLMFDVNSFMNGGTECRTGIKNFPVAARWRTMLW
jgi:hypothetical protein